MLPSRRRSGRTRPSERPRTEATTTNEVWTCDYKGQFRTGDGLLCYPLTRRGFLSRFVLVIHGFPSVAGDLAWSAFEQAFRCYGLPQVIRSDNGSPFASSLAIAGLSRLCVRWLKLGIRVERIEPAHPEQNGRHEQMHRILKAETTRPPAADSSGPARALRSFPPRVQPGPASRGARTEAAPRDLPAFTPALPQASPAARISGPLRGAVMSTGVARSSGREDTCSSARLCAENGSGSRSTMTACGPSTFAACAWLVSMKGNANCMANRPRGGGSSGRPSGFPPSRRPLPGAASTNHFRPESVTYVSGLKCVPTSGRPLWSGGATGSKDEKAPSLRRGAAAWGRPASLRRDQCGMYIPRDPGAHGAVRFSRACSCTATRRSRRWRHRCNSWCRWYMQCPRRPLPRPVAG